MAEVQHTRDVVGPTVESFTASARKPVRLEGERRANDPAVWVGAGLERFGDAVRRFSIALGSQVERAGGYLKRRKAAGVRLDAEQAIINRPMVAMLAALAAGYTIARVVRR